MAGVWFAVCLQVRRRGRRAPAYRYPLASSSLLKAHTGRRDANSARGRLYLLAAGVRQPA